MESFILTYLGPIGGGIGILALTIVRSWLKRIEALEARADASDKQLNSIAVDVSYIRGCMESKTRE